MIMASRQLHNVPLDAWLSRYWFQAIAAAVGGHGTSVTCISLNVSLIYLFDSLQYTGASTIRRGLWLDRHSVSILTIFLAHYFSDYPMTMLQFAFVTQTFVDLYKQVTCQHLI